MNQEWLERTIHQWNNSIPWFLLQPYDQMRPQTYVDAWDEMWGFLRFDEVQVDGRTALTNNWVVSAEL